MQLCFDIFPFISPINKDNNLVLVKIHANFQYIFLKYQLDFDIYIIHPLK